MPKTFEHSIVSPSSSLRLRGLAQASHPLRLGEAQEQERGQHGISLRRDPSRMGELPARSKVTAGSLGDHSWRKRLRRASVNLTWARLARLGEFNSARHCFHLQETQIRTTSNNSTVSYIHINR
ncbi:hypothetical protein DEO72_LG5g1747 [Vigna unguiculata]|uniref:Uncharacterized protein n=1 Tax=Vigna unguiculata TaxID=3917 RepID=A0A4D6LZ94_VIGUN|nr:hypothetical protein DEO72_LG5g1747 [Vigna unguiculata]